MNPNIQEIRGTDSWNFETLKYNISNESNDILLGNAYDPDLNFFSTNFKNLDTVYVFRRHGVMTWIILHMVYQTIQVAIKKGVIAKVGEFLSTFIILPTSELDLTFLLTTEILNYLH